MLALRARDLASQFLDGLGHENQPTERDNPFALKKHVLGPAQADAFRAELDGHGGIVRRIGIRTHRQLPILVGERHNKPEGAGQRRLDGVDLVLVDRAGRPVKRDPVAFFDGRAVDRELSLLVVDGDIPGAGHAALAHPAGHDRGVGGHAAPRGQNSFGDGHAPDVLGAGLNAAQDYRLAQRGFVLGFVRAEHDPAGRRARRGRQAHGQLLRLIFGRLDEHGVEQLVQRGRIDAFDGRLLVDQLLLYEIGGNLDRRGRGALTVAGLQHVQRAVLDREFDILHVLVMALQFDADRVELLEDFGHGFFEGGVVLLAPGFADALRFGPIKRAQPRQLLRGADARYHVFALRVDQVLAIEIAVIAGRWVARERHTRGRVVAGIPEHHRLHVHRGSQQAADIVERTVLDGARVVPGAEHGLDAREQLLHGVVGEGAARVALNHFAVARDNVLQVGRGQVGIQRHAARFLDGVEFVLEIVMRNVHNHVAEHLDEPAVGIHDESFVAGQRDHRVNRLGVQPQVQHGIHHARHGGGRARAHGQQERLWPFAKRLPRRLLQCFQRGLGLRLHQRHQLFPTKLIVFVTGFRGDRESRRHGQSQVRHPGQVRAFPAQNRLHVGAAFRLLAAEVIYVFLASLRCHDSCRPLR